MFISTSLIFFFFFFFFFNDTATTEIYTLSLHDALPISWQIISPDLTRQDPGVPPNLGVFVESDSAKGKHRGVIYSLAPSPKDVNLMWAGTDDGLIHVTRDGGTNWANVTPPELN